MNILQFVLEHKWALIVGALLGLALGLLVGWVIWPTELRNATPGHLRSDFQHNYIRWVADQYANDSDQNLARTRLGLEFWEKGTFVAAVDKMLTETQGGEEAIHLRALQMLAETSSPTSPASPTEQPAQDGGGLLGSLLGICGVGLLVVLLVGGGVFLIMRIRARQAESQTDGVDAGAAREYAPADDVVWGVDGPPLVQFPTTYVLGDDHYDPSFSIELENGEFMGECGVGVSETIGVGKPNKITALEVWLFDKSDIRTVTKVLMSDYAFNDEALKTKLAPKGEPVLAGGDQDIVLETKTLRIRARVAEVEYGMGDLPANSFFDKVAIELMVWVVSQQEGGQPMTDVDEYAMPPIV
ncbi:MAG: hypothetical protein GY832_29780 [Chloroflexi bacterium]|nr:hypothetical protein [Chloroflexota bacterium]